VSNVVDFYFTFSGCTSFNGNLSSWSTINAVNMGGMFSGATKFQGRGLSDWDTSSFQSTDSMFKDAVSFVGDLSSWDVSRVNSMNTMVCIIVDIV
jgi:Mycoplasma protein of unknown function, DUF285